MTITTVREGGCSCGAIRYRLVGEPNKTLHCHCIMCRRAAGAPFVTWALYPSGALTITSGRPATYRSSTWATRSFCEKCGTQLIFRYDSSGAGDDVTVASLDDPESLSPSSHVWAENQLSWLELADDLPRHAQETKPSDAC